MYLQSMKHTISCVRDPQTTRVTIKIKFACNSLTVLKSLQNVRVTGSSEKYFWLLLSFKRYTHGRVAILN